MRWTRRLPAYLAWQREREASGWRWAQAEMKVRRILSLEDGGSVELYGRIDRIDEMRGAAQGVSLVDYLGRMKEGQEVIYYITADSLAAAVM